MQTFAGENLHQLEIGLARFHIRDCLKSLLKSQRRKAVQQSAVIDALLPDGMRAKLTLRDVESPQTASRLGRCVSFYFNTPCFPCVSLLRPPPFMKTEKELQSHPNFYLNSIHKHHLQARGELQPCTRPARPPAVQETIGCQVRCK